MPDKKRNRIALVAMAVLLVAFPPAAAFAASVEPGHDACTIQISTPNGGENWTVATKHNITWTQAGGCNLADQAQVEFSTSGASGPWSLVVDKTALDQPFEWIVPFVGTTANAFIRVSHPQAQDASDAAFTIWRLPGSGPCVLETVDSAGGTGLYPSMAIGAGDEVHVSYFNLGNSIKYANWTAAAGWKNEHRWPTAKGWQSSIALDPAGNPGIGFFADPGQVAFMRRNGTGGGWLYSDLPGNLSNPRDIDTTSLAFGADGRARLAAGSVGAGGDFVYAVQQGASWSVSRIETAFNGGTGISLALDGGGTPHVAYPNLNRTLDYARLNGTRWEISRLGGADRDGTSMSLALDPAGGVHVGYWDAGSWGPGLGITYSALVGGQWTREVVDPSGVAPVALALDSQGRPHLAYFSPSPPGLVHAVKNGTRWENVTVETGVTGRAPSGQGSVAIRMDSGGNTHLAYYDDVNSDLKHAKCPPGGGGVAAPRVTMTSPASDALGVPRTDNVTVRFDQPMDPASTAAAFSLMPAVSGGSASAAGDMLEFHHSSTFAANMTYTVTVADTAQSAGGKRLVSAYSFKFTTSAAPPPPPNRTIDGVVKDAEGRPVAGAKVEVFEVGNPTPLASFVTLADGAYRFTLPGGRDYYLRVTGPDGEQTTSDTVRLDGDKQLDVTMRPRNPSSAGGSTSLLIGAGVIAGIAAALAAAFFLRRRSRKARTAAAADRALLQDPPRARP